MEIGIVISKLTWFLDTSRKRYLRCTSAQATLFLGRTIVYILLSMLWHGLVLYTFGYMVLVVAEPLSRLVTIEQGPVKGYMAPEGDVFIFYGIPYATAPTGTQKFRPPLPPPSWTDIYEAVQSNIVCPQNLAHQNNADKGFQMQEDCLIANVYVPDTVETNLPVLVYFHGGAYQYGYGTRRSPVNIVKSKKIIAVNFNYRLGAHGLLCLGTKDAPGNAGLKDQVALLRWVQKNIVHFGGNPNDVTINGCSAGGASVDLVMISKITRGLFHKVIPESGSNTASICIQVDPVASAKVFVKELVNEDVEDIETLENFYKAASLETLYSLDIANTQDGSLIFAPCIERDIGEEMFLDDHPVNILNRGDYPKLPMLYGVTEMEGIYRMANFDVWKDQMNKDFSNFLPEDLIFANKEEKSEVAQKVKQFYFGNELISNNDILNYIMYFTDVMFGYGVAKNVKLQVEAGNDRIYLYNYAFVDVSADYIPHTNVRGAAHCAQAAATMDLGEESKLSQEYQDMKSVMRDLWLNFITTGKPVPDDSKYPAWPPVGINRSPYMYLNSTLELKNSFLGNRALFWDEIYDHFEISYY